MGPGPSSMAGLTWLAGVGPSPLEAWGVAVTAGVGMGLWCTRRGRVLTSAVCECRSSTANRRRTRGLTTTRVPGRQRG
jgi:hypothetical protein